MCEVLGFRTHHTPPKTAKTPESTTKTLYQPTNTMTRSLLPVLRSSLPSGGVPAAVEPGAGAQGAAGLVPARPCRHARVECRDLCVVGVVKGV